MPPTRHSFEYSEVIIVRFMTHTVFYNIYCKVYENLKTEEGIMLNLCVFIFVIYAVSYSAKAILFGKTIKKQKKGYCAARNTTDKTNITPQRCKRSKPNIVKIRQTKSGRMGKSPVRPVLFQFCIDIIIMLVYYKYSNGTVLAVLL